jgi:hypothetical protein
MTGMAGIILIGVLNVLMFFWFGYQFSQDKANVWKRKRTPQDGGPSDPRDGGASPPQG